MIYFCFLEVTTVEGVIDRSITGLEQDQPLRRIEHPDVAAQIDEFIQKLKQLKELKEPFTLVRKVLQVIKICFLIKNF